MSGRKRFTKKPTLSLRKCHLINLKFEPPYIQMQKTVNPSLRAGFNQFHQLNNCLAWGYNTSNLTIAHITTKNVRIFKSIFGNIHTQRGI